MMSHLSRASSRLSNSIRFQQRIPLTAKHFSTESAEPALGSLDDSFLRTPSSGSAYGKLTYITKHTTKTDVIRHFDECNLNLENLKVEYDRYYNPISMLVEFTSKTDYGVAIRTINKKGRFLTLSRADKSQWDGVAPYDGKAILLKGIPPNALIDDIERFLHGCQYDSSSFQIFTRPTSEGLLRMALVRFPSQTLAMHAYITKNRGFCLNNQITVQVLY